MMNDKKCPQLWGSLNNYLIIDSEERENSSIIIAKNSNKLTYRPMRCPRDSAALQANYIEALRRYANAVLLKESDAIPKYFSALLTTSNA